MPHATSCYHLRLLQRSDSLTATDRSTSQVAPPVPRTRLIGRERERSEALAQLIDAGVPLLTLTGPGGVGKTRLALAIAADAAEHFANGAIWVDLSLVTDPNLVTMAVATALGMTLPDAATSPDEIIRLLRPRQALLLLDTCEHLLDAVAPLVSRLLERCPALQVLATSRAPLRVRGETVASVVPWPLPPGHQGLLEEIAPNPAVTLFVERTRAVLPSFSMTADTAGEVVEICRRLDGMPLAIELAAARMSVHTPATLLDELTHAITMDGTPHRDLPARQQTLEATIAWSYALLNAESQALFRYLAVFVGGFTLPAASYVMGAREHGGAPTNSALPLLSELLDQSLVYRVDHFAEPRFAMLDTVRAFALTRLEEADEHASATRMHAAYFVNLVKPIDADTRVRRKVDDWKLLALADQANFRAALDTLVALNDAVGTIRLATSYGLGNRFNPREALPLIEWALANTPDLPVGDRGVALAELAFLYWTQARYDEARPLALASLEIGRRIENLEVISDALDALGSIDLSLHHYESAKQAFVEAIEYWRIIGDRAPLASQLQLLAGAEHGLGEEAAALEHAKEALTIYHELQLPVGVSTTLARIGRQMRDMGFDHAAAVAFREALELCAAGTDRVILVQAYAGLAEIASRHGQAEAAAALIGAIDEVARDLGAKRLPTAGVNYDRARDAATAILGAASFATLRERGMQLRLDQAVALARLVRFPAARTDEPATPWSRLDRSNLDPHHLPLKRKHAADHDAVTVLLQRRPTTATTLGLTEREQEVLGFLGERLTDAEIAERLFISRRTASNHVANIIAKLDATNRRDAAAIAARLALI